MEERINEKIKEIEIYLEQIYSWLPTDFEEYERDVKSKAACEKNLEVISEYLVDIAIYLIRLKNLRTPNDDESTFKILAEKNIISDELCKKMISLRGMRNFIAHRYGEVNNLKVFDAFKEEFRDDVEEFLNSVRKAL